MANPTIIVADDDEMVRDTLSRQLTAKGYEVRSAADGAEAWELFQQLPSEILITDLDMPRITGHQLIAKVKYISPMTIVIVLTGHGTLESAMQLIDIGCEEYLLKPFEDINEIDLVLKRSIERHRLFLQSIVCKRVNMAKSKMIHDLTYELVEPTHTLLKSIDILIDLIKEGDDKVMLSFGMTIRKNVTNLCAVVGKLAVVVPSHDIARLQGGAGDEAVHQPAINTVERVGPIVGAALVDEFGVVGGGDAGTAGRVGDADAGRDAFGAGIGAEVMIEAAILLHDEDEVLDLLEARRRGGRRGVLRGGAAYNRQCHQDQGQQGKAGADSWGALHDTPSKPRRRR